ncbi:MAG: hypothetical protein GX896_00585 [Clostridiales bacterium]|nr:hypothetical protein [Clostridiales bacterium]
MNHKNKKHMLPVRFRFIIIFAISLILVSFIVYMLCNSLDDIVPSHKTSNTSNQTSKEPVDSDNNGVTTTKPNNDVVYVITTTIATTTTADDTSTSPE